MLDPRDETRAPRYIAILAATVMCISVPSLGARRQASSSEATSAKSPAESTGHTSSTTKKTGSTKHGTTASASHKSTSMSARTSATAHHSTRHTSRKSKSARARGQQKIDSERATSIQQALIREHYLNGEPSGVWDAESEAAMRRYQGDHGWQTKEVPDSRALIKLGLGPNNDHLLNPESAMTSTPIARRNDPPTASASHASTSTQPAAKAGTTQPSVTPAAVPQTTPAAPATPQKDPGDSSNPQ